MSLYRRFLFGARQEVERPEVSRLVFFLRRLDDGEQSRCGLFPPDCARSRRDRRPASHSSPTGQVGCQGGVHRSSAPMPSASRYQRSLPSCGRPVRPTEPVLPAPGVPQGDPAFATYFGGRIGRQLLDDRRDVHLQLASQTQADDPQVRVLVRHRQGDRLFALAGLLASAGWPRPRRTCPLGRRWQSGFPTPSLAFGAHLLQGGERHVARPKGKDSSGLRLPRRRSRNRTWEPCTSRPAVLTWNRRPRSVSAVANLPPTAPGRHQLLTNTEPSGATQTSAGRNQLSRAPCSRFNTSAE